MPGPRRRVARFAVGCPALAAALPGGNLGIVRACGLGLRSGRRRGLQQVHDRAARRVHATTASLGCGALLGRPLGPQLPLRREGFCGAVQHVRGVLLFPLQTVVDVLVWRVWHDQELYHDLVVGRTDAVRSRLRLLHRPRHPVKLGEDHETSGSEGQALAACGDGEQGDAAVCILLELLHELGALRSLCAAVNAHVVEVLCQLLFQQLRYLVHHQLMVHKDDGLLVAPFEHLNDVLLHRRQLSLRRLHEECGHRLAAAAPAAEDIHERAHLRADLFQRPRVGDLDRDALAPLRRQLRKDLLLEAPDHDRGGQEVVQLGSIPGSDHLVHDTSIEEL
mmetsp:Transcript_125541/g.349487  ORF Transcript_125541/g.349487 Transcript_125541/m.349487 type:complete len:335 (+) Transcript_125541:181-1185(+)